MFRNSNLIEKAKTARFKPNIALQLLIFVAVFISVSIATGIVLVIPLVRILFDSGFFEMAMNPNADFGEIYNKAMEISTSETILLFSLFATVFEIAIPVMYCRFIEKRPLSSMGFVKKGAISNYLLGYLIGAAMIAASVGIAAAFGTLEIKITENIPIGTIIIFFIGFLIQGAAEETLCRGYLMMSLSNRCHIAIAVGISSVVFSFMHLANPGITVLALVNIALFGVLMALFILRTNSIWGACAMHSAWNFFQGNIFGIQVSGNANTTSVLTSQPSANTFVNGGSFGLEGGIAVTIVLAITLAAIVLLPKKSVEPAEI